MLLNHSLIPSSVVRTKEWSTILSFDSQKPLYSLEIHIPPYEIKPTFKRHGVLGHRVAFKNSARRRWKVSLPSSKVLGTGCDSNVSAKGGVIAQQRAHHHGDLWPQATLKTFWENLATRNWWPVRFMCLFIFSNLVQEIDCFWLERLRIGLGPCTRHSHRCEQCDGMLCTVIELTWCRGQTHFSRRGRLKHL